MGNLSGHQWSQVEAIMEQHSGKPGALIPVIEEMRGAIGCLPESVQRRVAQGLGIPLEHVHEVVTLTSRISMHRVRTARWGEDARRETTLEQPPFGLLSREDGEPRT